MPASNPDRDLHLARRQRLGFRRAEPLANEIEDLLGSEDFQRMRRFQKVNGALRQVLSVAQIHRLKPVSLKAGLVFNPAASLDVLDWVIDDLDLVQLPKKLY